MSSLVDARLESNSKIKINFDGGDLSSDTGLFLCFYSGIPIKGTPMLIYDHGH